MTVTDRTPTDIEATLRDRFALERFRTGQREVIEQVLAGNDVLCVMPTGGGKSLCYQLPAVQLKGVTLVVSPLIALMKDQVDALTARGIRATLINSTLDLAEQNARIAEIEMGHYDLVYVAPERFRSGRFVEMMNRVRPALLAVDEAHCISEWGHDFRPDYARLGAARRALGMPPCIALTATATDLVRRDIADQLDLRDPKQFVTGFDRPNLSYRAREARKDAEKLAAVASILDRNPGASIIYANSRKRCEEVGVYLAKELRRKVAIYHAGMTREERSLAQERFMGGDAEVVVATNAFGMGIDKADIRSVIHFNMPGTLEAYYQEAGRAGRDGLPAECILLSAPGDRYLQEMFIENEYPPADAVYRIYDYLRSLDADPIELTHQEIKESTPIELNESAIGTAIRILESAGALERFRPRENMAIVRINAEPDEPPIAERLGANAHVQRLVAIGLEGLVNRKYGEPIYFQPDEFATALGLDRTALTRAIKNLAADFPLDYVPPFRGNAVRILDRKRRGRDLKIDFSSLQKRKKQEYEKLDRMVRYVESKSCRRAFILGYFGDTDVTHCGRCDNCGGPVSARAAASRPIDTPAGREVIQKVLSGVARAKARFGKTAVAQMLLGSGSERIGRSGLARLSTFGILAKSGFTQKDLTEILDGLLAAGLVESEEVDRLRPVIKLSDQGWDWIRNPDSPPITLPIQDQLVEKLRLGGLERMILSAASVRSPQQVPLGEGHSGVREEPASSNEGLHDRLRRLRLTLAREAGLSPAYIFTNETLDELVQLRPQTPQALARVKGIGPAKLERFGVALLEAIAAGPAPDVSSETFMGVSGSKEPSANRSNGHPGHEADERFAPPKRAAAPAASTLVTTEEWTRRLLERGFTIVEAAAIRGMEEATVIRHALQMAESGRPIPLRSFLTPDELDGWNSWIEANGTDAPPADDPEQARDRALFLACRAALGS